MKLFGYYTDIKRLVPICYWENGNMFLRSGRSLISLIKMKKLLVIFYRDMFWPSEISHTNPSLFAPFIGDPREGIIIYSSTL
jgi:hypothetical protein